MPRPHPTMQSSLAEGAGLTWTLGSLLNSASSDLSILESFSSRRLYQNVCIADSGQLIRVSTCPPPQHVRRSAKAGMLDCITLKQRCEPVTVISVECKQGLLQVCCVKAMG